MSWGLGPQVPAEGGGALGFSRQSRAHGPSGVRGRPEGWRCREEGPQGRVAGTAAGLDVQRPSGHSGLRQLHRQQRPHGCPAGVHSHTFLRSSCVVTNSTKQTGLLLAPGAPSSCPESPPQTRQSDSDSGPLFTGKRGRPSPEEEGRTEPARASP